VALRLSALTTQVASGAGETGTVCAKVKDETKSNSPGSRLCDLFPQNILAIAFVLT
jgi:hypothetical protein